ncbi:MAG TPA: tryptophan synthase subunit alpha [Candidatus Sumerlaeota bacterium]|nr:tryptophan synthase subunit alpha [Candidatus Sumerlaeota bacterium]HPS02136.1 tryptophan synthase subunit alpha [Candidatus Sumerlaeota bacterium]
MNRIESHFAEATREGRKSLILFLTAGFPHLDLTEAIIDRVARAGCDVLELGVPFSDPIADGPTIQAASTEALKAETTLEKILDLVARIRDRFAREGRPQLPILLFGAYNPFYHYGLDTLVKRAQEVGVDGFLVPDLPIEESEEFETPCRRAGLSLIYLVAPTTPSERMAEIARHGSGFLYYISLRGVTGTAIAVGDELREHVATLRKVAAPLPVAVGFGIQTPEHVRQVAEISPAVVVGSALIRLIGEQRNAPDLLDQVEAYCRSLKEAL